MNNLKRNKVKGNFMSINRILSKKTSQNIYGNWSTKNTLFIGKKNEIIYLIIACVFNGLKLICLEQFVQYLK